MLKISVMVVGLGVAMMGSVAMSQEPPQPLYGTFAFTGRVSPEMQMIVETVNTLTASGKARLQELQEAGYTCQPRLSQWYRCDRFAKEALPEDIEQQVSGLFADKTLVFLQENRGSELLYQGDWNEQWAVYNPVLFDGRRYEQYWVQITPNLTKITIGKPDEQLYFSFVLNADGSLSLFHQMTRNRPSGWVSYLNFIEFAL